MTGNGTPPASVTLPAESICRIARLLADLDEFLRSTPTLPDQLARFLQGHGDGHPRFTANNIIDEVGFTAAWLQTLAADAVPETACDPPLRAAQSPGPGPDGQHPPRRSGS